MHLGKKWKKTNSIIGEVGVVLMDFSLVLYETISSRDSNEKGVR
jgi:hypothetical protein